MMNFIELLICYTATLLSQLSAIYLFKKLSNKQIKINKNYIFIILVASIIQVLLNIYTVQGLGTIFTIVYFYYMFQRLFNCSKTESQNYSIIIWSISLLIDIFLMVLGTTFGLMKFYYLNSKIYKSIASIIMSIILIGISNLVKIISYMQKLYKKMFKLNIPIRHIFIIVVLFSSLAIISFKYSYNKLIVIVLFGLGIIFLVTIVMFISMNYEIVTLKITNEILEKNNEANQKVIYQSRILKHSLESQLMGVKTVANKKAKELLDNLIKEYNESFYIKHDINSMPLGINGLVFEKLYKYNEDKIEISITNKIKSKILNTVGPRSYNLFCEALGVTLDNALESAKESKDKLVYIEFRESKDYVQMKIMNTFHGNIDLDKLGTVNYTSKSEGHGLGLYSLFGRKNLTITTSIKNNLFVNKIEVKKLKK